MPVCAKYGHRFRFLLNIQKKKKLTRHMLSSVASFSDVMTVPLQIHSPDEPWLQAIKTFAKEGYGTCIAVWTINLWACVVGGHRDGCKV